MDQITQFVSIDFLTSWAGIIAIVMLVTQFCKDLWDTKISKTRTKYVVLLISFLLLLLTRIFAGFFAVIYASTSEAVFYISRQVFLTLLDSFAITMIATNGYDYLLSKPTPTTITAEQVESADSNSADETEVSTPPTGQ